MQLTVNRDDLAKAVAASLPATEVKGSMPILANVHLKGNGHGVIELRTTDLETFYHGSAPARIYEPGEITVNARALEKALKYLTKGSAITLAANGDGKLSILHGASKVRLGGSPASEFPPSHTWPAGPALTLPALDLRALIDHVMFSAPTDDLNGPPRAILWQTNNNRLRLVTTDGHRLSVADSDPMAFNSVSFGDGVIVPLKGMAALWRFLDKQKNIKIALTSKHLAARRPDGAELFIRLVDKKFPEYRRIVPQPENCAIAFRVNRGAIIDALKKVTQLSNERFKLVIFAVNGVNMGLRYEDMNVGECQETLTINRPAHNPDFTTAFNARYLLEPLAAMRGDTVTLQSPAPDRPWLLTGADDPGYQAVIMPANL